MDKPSERLNITQKVQLDYYLRMLSDWNKVHNLSGSHDTRELKAKHIDEAMRLADLILHDCRPIYDVGAGAGALGIVIAIVHGAIEVNLIEKARKKCAFLRHCRHQLDLLNLNVIEERVQDCQFPDQGYQIVTRAFASLERSAELFGAKLHSRATWLALKGINYQDELKKMPANLQLVQAHALGSIEADGKDLGFVLEIKNAEAS